MKPQFNNRLISSFALWMDNLICNNGQGYINVTGTMMRETNPSVTGKSWAAPFKGWVYDSSVNGAYVISGVYNQSGQFLTRASGVSFDFNRGRVYSPYDWGTTLSGVYSRKEYNVYVSTEEETDFVLEKIKNENANLTYVQTGVSFDRFAAPFILLTNAINNNVPFAFGGLEESEKTLRAFVISDNNFNQEALNSLLVDANKSYLPLVAYSDVPINSRGDLKTGYYSYAALKSQYGCGDVLVKDVFSYKTNEKENQNKNFTISIMEFDVSKLRFPRQEIS